MKTTKPRQKFIRHILILNMRLRGKYNFVNMPRYVLYTDLLVNNKPAKAVKGNTQTKSMLKILTHKKSGSVLMTQMMYKSIQALFIVLAFSR